MNIACYLERHAIRNPDRVAIRFEGLSVTYDALNRDASRLADALRRSGIAAGDRVALFLPNIPQFAVAYYAVQKLGAVVVTINAIFKTDEVRYLLDDSEAVAVFTTAELAAFVPADCPCLKLKVIVDESAADAAWIALARLYAEGSDGFRSVERAPDDDAALLYSSGTTGFPKGVVLTQRNIHSNIALAAASSDYRPRDRICAFLPLFHVYGQNYIMNACLMAGATIVLFRRFAPEVVLPAIGSERITHFFAVPAIYIGLLASDLSPYDLSSVRYEMSAAASMPEEISRRWFDRFGRRIYEGYGLTESSPVASYNDLHEYRFGTVGRALPGVEMMIFDEADHEVPPGGLGEIVIRGENVMKAYWKRPEDTAQALRGGWLHTGDIGRMDEDGYVTIVDRVKDMINAAGFKVWPAEVEHYLYKLDGIREVAVFGIPHPEKGEQVAAAVVLKPDSGLTAEAIVAHCRDSIAAYKVPAQVDLVDSLPKSPTGKLLKRILREDYAKRPAKV
jgi:long-chain acyl-CoA synthetase